MGTVLRQFFDWHVIRTYLPALGRGFWITFQLALFAELIALTLGLALALMRRARVDGPPWRRVFGRLVRGLSIAYINFFRGVPSLLVILLFWGSFPQFHGSGLDLLSDFQIGFIALGMVYAAYLAEVYRAGIDAVDRGQTEAARSLGMSGRSAMRLIIIPQAIRKVLPPLMNDFIALSKDTALVGVIAVSEVVAVARDAQVVEANSSAMIGAAAYYLVFTLPLIWLLDRMIAREQRKTGRGMTAMIP